MQAKPKARGGEAGDTPRNAHGEGDGCTRAPLLAVSTCVMSTRMVTSVVLAMENLCSCAFSLVIIVACGAHARGMKHGC